MKFNKTTQKNWLRVAVSALMFTAVSAYGETTADGKLAAEECRTVGALIVSKDQLMTQFFSSDSSVPYNDFVIAFTKKEQEYVKKFETFNAAGPLSKRSHAIFQETLKYLSAAIGVIKQYVGKPADQALKFVNDMDKVFSPETAFNSISTKLQALLLDAQSAGETELITVIQQLMTVLHKKKFEWGKKSNISLLTGLTKRMSCK